MSHPNRVKSSPSESLRSTLNIGPERRLGTVALDDPRISQVTVSVSKIDATDLSDDFVFGGLIYGVDVQGDALDINLIEAEDVLHRTIAKRLGLKNPYWGPTVQLGGLTTRIGGVYGIYSETGLTALRLFYDSELPDAPIMPRATGLAIATALTRTLGLDILRRHPDGPQAAPPLDISLDFASTPEIPTLGDTVRYTDMANFVCNAQPYGPL